MIVGVALLVTGLIGSLFLLESPKITQIEEADE